ncbi:MAG: tRNA (adenosine(37)-N6)-threonylcarbamoyltransferase complex dimerization subunit type 1 TsaB [Chitinophagaceae bacterium]|nr:MAG: tRNA (adenosine(37)-N6)-threonylcarbamoyltransferase complex dimerization subunit type 1 TsaB [Chitinophagaceae bacterium]
MAMLLMIETAVQSASVCLAKDYTFISEMINPAEKESAAWLHTATEQLLNQNNTRLQQLSAIAISAGPGSYTGLRVGMAAAKGLCYALNIPLITINTLQIMAASIKETSAGLLCPMIDARRMEVFTAIYDRQLSTIMPPKNLILDETAFQNELANQSICFFGNGSTKAKTVIQHSNAVFADVETTAANMIVLAWKKFEQAQFSDLAYTEPYYGKEFHSPTNTKNS